MDVNNDETDGRMQHDHSPTSLLSFPDDSKQRKDSCFSIKPYTSHISKPIDQKYRKYGMRVYNFMREILSKCADHPAGAAEES